METKGCYKVITIVKPMVLTMIYYYVAQAVLEGCNHCQTDGSHYDILQCRPRAVVRL